MRGPLTREGLSNLMKEIAGSAPRRGSFRVYLVGGGTAVQAGWRATSIDVDLHADDDAVFGDVPRIKERLGLNIEFARPEQFVPPLAGSESRHVFLETRGNVSFYHYDPYAQLLSKIVRGFGRDLEDAARFVASGMVEPERFRALVREIPDAAYAKYPALTREAVEQAVEAFLTRPPR